MITFDLSYEMSVDIRSGNNSGSGAKQIVYIEELEKYYRYA